MLPHVFDGAAVGSRLGKQPAHKPGTKPASSTAEPVVRHGGYGTGRTEPSVGRPRPGYGHCLRSERGTGATTGNTVSVIDGRTCRAADVAGCGRRPSTVTVGAAPSALAVDPSTDTVYVTNGNDTVAVIDGATCNAEVSSGCGQTPPEVTVGNGPSSVTIDPANHTAYVTDAGSNEVSMIDTLSCRASHLSGCTALGPPTVAVGVGPADTAVDELTHTVYVTNDDETGPNDGTTVSVLDASTCNSTTQSGCAHEGLVKVGTAPLAVAVDQSTNTIYTANNESNNVSVIDGRRCDAADLTGCLALTPASLVVGKSPNGATLDEPAHTLYVSDYDGNTLSVIGTGACNSAHLAGCSRTVPHTLQTGEEPNGVAVGAATSTLYVPNGLDNDVSVIDAAQCDAADTMGCRHSAPSVTGPSTGRPSTRPEQLDVHGFPSQRREAPPFRPVLNMTELARHFGPCRSSGAALPSPRCRSPFRDHQLNRPAPSPGTTLLPIGSELTNVRLQELNPGPDAAAPDSGPGARLDPLEVRQLVRRGSDLLSIRYVRPGRGPARRGHLTAAGPGWEATRALPCPMGASSGDRVPIAGPVGRGIGVSRRRPCRLGAGRRGAVGTGRGLGDPHCLRSERL